MMAASGSVLSSNARKQLLFAVRRVLRPIVRLLIRVGVSFDEFSNVSRAAYIESSIRDHSNAAPLSRDRVAFITGISRQRVDYYLDNREAMPMARPTLARVATQVVHRWHTDPGYLGPYGIPFELEFDTPRDRCFQSLVAEVDRGVSAGKVLEELLRAGSVAHSGEKHYRAITRWFIPPEALSSHRIEYFGNAITQLASTLEYNFNLADAESKRLERFVFADKGLPRELLPSFAAHARDRANQFLLDIDDWLAHRSEVDSNAAGPRIDAGVNVFLYVESLAEEPALSDLVQPSREVGVSEDTRVA
jgi:hypothetical protein